MALGNFLPSLAFCFYIQIMRPYTCFPLEFAGKNDVKTRWRALIVKDCVFWLLPWVWSPWGWGIFLAHCCILTLSAPNVFGGGSAWNSRTEREVFQASPQPAPTLWSPAPSKTTRGIPGATTQLQGTWCPLPPCTLPQLPTNQQS